MLDDIMSKVPEEPVEGLNFLINYFDTRSETFDYQEYLYFCSLLTIFIEKSNLTTATQEATTGTSLSAPQKAGNLVESIRPIVTEAYVRAKFDAKFNSSSLTGSALHEIQNQVNILRNNIQASSLEDEYKQRLLARLEKLQNELHKVAPNSEIIFSHIAKFGFTLGNFAENAKPFTDSVVRLIDSTRKLLESICKLDSSLPSLPTSRQDWISNSICNTNKD